MGKMSEREKAEFKEVTSSLSFRKDMQHLSANRFNPLRDGQTVNMDRLLVFLTEYNAFINHTPKPFKPMIDKMMKL